MERRVCQKTVRNTGAIHIFYFDKVTVVFMVQGHVHGLHDSIWSAPWIGITIRVSSLDMTWPALTKTCSTRRFDDVLQSPLLLIPHFEFSCHCDATSSEILRLDIFLIIFPVLYYDFFFYKYYYILVLHKNSIEDRSWLELFILNLIDQNEIISIKVVSFS